MLARFLQSLRCSPSIQLPPKYFTSASFLKPIIPASSAQRYKHKYLDYSKYPILKEEELEETFTRGSGPGGQAVNKTNNCVLLRHVPTNLLVKCHTHRITSRNRTEARKILLEKLDSYLNGEHSIESQIKTMETKKSQERRRRQTKLSEMKENWKAREQFDTASEDKENK